MSFSTIIIIIIALLLALKVKRFISGIQITTDKVADSKKTMSRKVGMDIQDADYEDVE